MIRDSILNFPQQLDYLPEIINPRALKKAKKFVVVGMGGSHLAADLIKIFKPSIDLMIYMSYGLPELPDLKDRLIILSSYSGNTEEVIDACKEARKRKLNVAVVSIGGEILEIAKSNNLPFIKLPEMDLQPRMALGLSLMALLKIIGDKEISHEIRAMAEKLAPAALEAKGQALAKRLKGSVPLIYSSGVNSALAYNWKIKFNENSKIPAFSNALPELNHNEMEGFDVNLSTKDISSKFYAIFLRDDADDPRILKRMKILEKLYSDRGVKTETVKVEGANAAQKIFNTILLGDWAAYYSAIGYGVDPEKVPMVEEFKKLMGSGRE